ncbi:hypothetical protein [Methylomicrobium sp. Wu6]|uniref:hypothetical protein n=1 Tax=Methylomicrobium sp. Wu6 TaxID=3107928 RepID=UPI002DD68966|nr:hypothetical protein [Methylomicrobium sp. Wu6]MEC4748392.1 hypothetical protein [Methylomicrobium sp. Wu6]
MTSKNAIGATDLFRINCGAPDTDHLNVKVIDTTPLPPSAIDPQLLHVNITKKGYQPQEAFAIAPGEKTELSVAAGKGSYKISVDTSGTNLDILTPQTFSVEYHCLNDADQLTAPAVARTLAKKIKNKKTSKFSVACGKSKTTGETTKLYVKFTNTTVDPAKVALNAQVIKGSLATNATDQNGDDFYSDEVNLPGGSGDYTVLVDNTAFDKSQDNSRDYSLQYSCRNLQNSETATETPLLIKQFPAP